MSAQHRPPDDIETERSPRARSLFGQILDWMLAPLLLLWPISIGVTYLIAKSMASVPFDHALESRVWMLSRQLDAPHGTVILNLPDATRDWLLDDPYDTTIFQVRSPDGKVLAGERALHPPALQDVSQPGIVQFRDDRLNGHDIRVAYAYASVHGTSGASPALIQVAETMAKRSALANDIIKGVIFPQFIILPLVIMLVWLGLARGLAPLHALQARIRARQPHDRSPLSTDQAPTEIAPLLQSFNDLLARLDDNTAIQKRFIAQAAHQMKTPLAGLRMQAELALRQPVSAEVQRSLEQIATSSRQAARLVSQLLSLARAEDTAQTRHAPMTDVDVDALARSVVQDWVSPAMEKSMDLGYEGPSSADPVRLQGQPVMLREMLSNLIDNAVRYTPSGGRITVRVQCLSTIPNGDASPTPCPALDTVISPTPSLNALANTNRTRPAVTIEVEDTGPGIPEAEREHVLERFYRILGREGDGSGLGLAIVNEIVSMHGGSLAVLAHSYQDHPPMEGTLIRVVLPCRTDRAV